jgi:hypothetical protein
MPGRSPQLESLRRVVRRFGGFRWRWSVLHGLALAVLALPGSLLVWFLLDWAFRLPPWPLVILFAVAAIGGIVAAIVWGVPPLFRRVKLEREAVVIESLHQSREQPPGGGLDNQLIGSLQLGEEVDRAAGRSLGYSPEFVSILLDRTSARLADLDPRSLLDLRKTKRLLLPAAAVIAAIALLAIFAGGAIQDRANRLRDAYAAVLDTLFPVELRVRPGDVAIVRGRPVELAVEAVGARRREIVLHRTDLKGSTDLGEKKAEATPLTLKDGAAAFTVDPTVDSFTYEFEYGGRRSKPHRVLVDDLPEINAINFELSPPSYTGQPARTLTGRLPKVAGLAGTTVLVSFGATTDLHPELCYVQWADGSKQVLSISGRFAHFGFTLSKPDRATIYLTGALGPGFEMAEPVAFDLAVVQDQPPTVKLAIKNRRIALFEDAAAAFLLNWTAEDDFAVAEVNLEYKIDTIDPLLGRSPREGGVPRRIEPARDLVKGRFADMFKSLDPPLAPGDRITITLVAKDNNTETGPGAGRSPPVEIVVVRPDLAGFVEQNFGFGGAALLGGLQKVKRNTDLLIEATKTVRTETKLAVDKQPLKAGAGSETTPGGADDAMADYFNLLSGESQ